MTDPQPPSSPSVRPVQYKGEPLDSERGPGLGCFRFQLGVLLVLIVLTPLSVAWGWPEIVSAILLFTVLVLLLVAGQTVIFLLRLVAADRRTAGRRRPLGSATPTVGEIEDARAAGHGEEREADGDAERGPPGTPPEAGPPDGESVRQ